MSPEDKTSPWPWVVGSFMISFGNVELILFNWIEKLSTDKIVRDVAIDLPLNKRLNLLCDLIKRSNLPGDRKSRALYLWGEIGKFSVTRNILAHSPFITNTETGKSGFIDVKKLKGSALVAITPLLFTDIAKDGSAVAKVLEELIEEFGRDI